MAPEWICTKTFAKKDGLEKLVLFAVILQTSRAASILNLNFGSHLSKYFIFIRNKKNGPFNFQQAIHYSADAAERQSDSRKLRLIKKQSGG